MKPENRKISENYLNILQTFYQIDIGQLSEKHCNVVEHHLQHYVFQKHKMFLHRLTWSLVQTFIFDFHEI